MKVIYLCDYDGGVSFFVEGDVTDEQVENELLNIYENNIDQIITKHYHDRFGKEICEENIDIVDTAIEQAKTFDIGHFIMCYNKEIMNELMTNLNLKEYEPEKKIYISVNKIGGEK